jgi:dTMP kinase
MDGAMFITLEGIDGSGKTTQAALVSAALRRRGYQVLQTREPGGTLVGDQIRELVLDRKKSDSVLPHTELLLFCASRAQLVGEVIKPRLAEGYIVVCDRFADSTLAYQGYGQGLDLERLRVILDFATQGLVPDLTLYLDLAPEIGLQRRRKASLFQGEDFNRLDAMKLAFHQRVHRGYQALIAQTPSRWQRVNADQPEQDVHAALMQAVDARLPQKQPESTDDITG